MSAKDERAHCMEVAEECLSLDGMIEPCGEEVSNLAALLFIEREAARQEALGDAVKVCLALLERYRVEGKRLGTYGTVCGLIVMDLRKLMAAPVKEVQ